MHKALNVVGQIAEAVYVLFLPGFALSFLFFRKSDKETDLIERVAVSFALSIAVVPLLAFYLNLLGIKISRWSVLLEALAIILLASLGAWLINKRKKQ